jgi:glycosyltransferase involved in cell wall biosynthesis
MRFFEIVSPDKKVSFHISLTPFTHESRALKESKSSIVAGLVDNVLVAAVWEPGLQEMQNLDNMLYVRRVRIRSRRLSKGLLVQAIKYLELLIRMAWGLRGRRISIIHSHSLAALPIGVAFKLLWRTKLVYDAHELESELNFTGFRKSLYRKVEKSLIRFADGVLVVSDAIADWYSHNYQIRRPTVVRNIPETGCSQNYDLIPLKERFQMAQSDILFIYQGALAPGRGTERMLKIFSQVRRDRHIVFMGSGLLAPKVKECEEKFENIHYLEPVPPAQVIQYTSSADVGFCLTENTCLSHYYSLPNKFFEYLISGLPVIINDLPEQRKIIEEYDCGWLGGENDQILMDLINSLSVEEIQRKREKANLTRNYLSWNNEFQKLLGLYRQCLGLKE